MGPSPVFAWIPVLSVQCGHRRTVADGNFPPYEVGDRGNLPGGRAISTGLGARRTLGRKQTSSLPLRRGWQTRQCRNRGGEVDMAPDRRRPRRRAVPGGSQSTARSQAFAVVSRVTSALTQRPSACSGLSSRSCSARANARCSGVFGHELVAKAVRTTIHGCSSLSACYIRRTACSIAHSPVN